MLPFRKTKPPLPRLHARHGLLLEKHAFQAVDVSEGKMKGVADEVKANGRKATTFGGDAGLRSSTVGWSIDRRHVE